MKFSLVKRFYNVNKYLKDDLNPSKHNYNKNPLDARLSHAWEGRIFLPKRLAQPECDYILKEWLIWTTFNYFNKLT